MNFFFQENLTVNLANENLIVITHSLKKNKESHFLPSDIHQETNETFFLYNKMDPCYDVLCHPPTTTSLNPKKKKKEKIRNLRLCLLF